MRICITLAWLLAAFFGSIKPNTASAEQGFDSEKASKLFRRCLACHEIGEGAKNSVGPHLQGIFGRLVGSIEGFDYSDKFKQLHKERRNWDKELLDRFLANPRKFAKRTNMNFVGVRNSKDRKHLILWLASLGESEPDTKLLGASATTLTGDAEYGEYLSGECVTCHQLNNANEGIPPIMGWSKDRFIHVMYEYKLGIRSNQAMATVSKRLGDEELAALAQYFGTLKQP